MPPPLLKRRIPSGRGATEQPNVTSDEAALTFKFWVAVVVTGVLTGLIGAGLMAILFHVEFLAFNFHAGSFQAAVERASGERRVASLLVAGAFGGVAWYLLRRFTPGELTDVDDALWDPKAGQLSPRRCLGTALISEVVVGMGASIGREAAPKLMGGVSGTVLSDWFGLTPAQRKLLVACGAGAGFAAVYNVPLAGGIFTAEVLIGSLNLPTVLPALACAWIATVTSWVYLPTHATYLNIPNYRFQFLLLGWAVVAGPLIGIFASGFIRLLAWVSYHRASGRLLLVAPLVAFGILGLVGLQYPQLFGNGQDLASMAFFGHGTLLLLFALFMLKPLVTSLCLRSGASGGLFTPTLSTGAVLGGFLGLAWSQLWPGGPVGAYAMIGAAAMMGSAMQAPLAGIALLVELTHSGFALLPPMIAATVGATLLARQVDGYSIYSARLAAHPGTRRPGT